MGAIKWIKANKPEKVLGALQDLMTAIDQIRDLFSEQKTKFEIPNLAEHAAECVSLVATNILSLKHWHFVK